ncbi:MAG TPA: sulfatase-like hydrolase/transferase, partial [Vicinamibacteria bacterium]
MLTESPPPVTRSMAARAALCGLLALGGAGCRRPSPASTCADCSVVLVSIDTLRADRLPAYGYAKGRTPHLDLLASRGILFEEAYSHCPLTLPAHACLLTGLLPTRHGVRDNVGFTLK